MNGRIKEFLKDLVVEFFGGIALCIVGMAAISGVVVLFRGPERGLPDFVWDLPELVYWIVAGAVLFGIRWAIEMVWIVAGAVVFGTWWAVNMVWRGLRMRGNTSPEELSEDA